METLRGQVERVRIVRDGWGTLVLLHGSASERATVTGHPLGVEEGDTIQVEGQWTTHPRYGRQFKASSIRTIAPSDSAGAIEWILSRLPGVGRKRATEMLERWPIPEVWEVLDRRPHELAVIDGITPKRAADIGRRYAEVSGERDRIVALRGWGLTDRQAARVVEKWGAEALEKLRENPYLLSEEVHGFGFLRSDAVAVRMGLPLDHPSRIRAGIVHVLREAKAQGHTYVPAGKLIAMTARMLGPAVDEGAVVREGRAVIAAGEMAQREARAGAATHIYPAELEEAEASVAASIQRLARGALERRAAARPQPSSAPATTRSSSSSTLATSAPPPEQPREFESLLEALGGAA